MRSIWRRLQPDTNDPLARGRAATVTAACLGLAAAVLLLLLVWLISGDLEMRTVGAAVAFGLLLAGIVALARSGRDRLALWLLTALLSLIVSANVGAYGLGSPSAAGYVIPIVLAACGAGLWAGMGVALYGAAFLWVTGLAISAGWYEALGPYEASHLTFNAPALTVLFALVALIAGVRVRYVESGMCRPSATDG